jgi:hypothetical protein
MIRSQVRLTVRPQPYSPLQPRSASGPCKTNLLASYLFTRRIRLEDLVWVEEEEWDEDKPWTTIYLKDLSGNGLHAKITPADGVIVTLPEDAGLIAADVDEIFFTDGAAQEVAVELLTSDDFIRIGTKGFVLLSAAQTGKCLEKTDKYVGNTGA